MARRSFDVIDVSEILMHWHAGRSKNEMAESLVDRKTLRLSRTRDKRALCRGRDYAG